MYEGAGTAAMEENVARCLRVSGPAIALGLAGQWVPEGALRGGLAGQVSAVIGGRGTSDTFRFDFSRPPAAPAAAFTIKKPNFALRNSLRRRPSVFFHHGEANFSSRNTTSKLLI